VQLVGNREKVLFEANTFLPMLKLQVRIAATRMELDFAWQDSALKPKNESPVSSSFISPYFRSVNKGKMCYSEILYLDLV
jgi:hypothetical protein